MSTDSTTGSAALSSQGFEAQMQALQEQTMQNELTMAQNQSKMQEVTDQVNLTNTARQSENSASKGS
jgi:hypothetical protein